MYRYIVSNRATTKNILYNKVCYDTDDCSTRLITVDILLTLIWCYWRSAHNNATIRLDQHFLQDFFFLILLPYLTSFRHDKSMVGISPRLKFDWFVEELSTTRQFASKTGRVNIVTKQSIDGDLTGNCSVCATSFSKYCAWTLQVFSFKAF